MNDRPADTGSTVTRARRAALAATVAAAMVAGLVLPSALAPAGAEAPTAASTLATATGSTLDPVLVAQLEAALDEGFAESGMPGVTVGLWIPGQGEWVATRGVSNLETDEPMNRANQQKIGSITKTLVGTVALQIIGEGQVGLTLDDTIDRWYPDFPEASSITVRMLMNMSSGAGSPGQAQLDRICADPYSTITPDEYIAIGAATPRAPFAPGEASQYSGFNTFLLGRILEKTTGTDFTTLVNERLLGPLGMTRSRYAPDGQLAAPLTHGYTDVLPGVPPSRPTPSTGTTTSPGSPAPWCRPSTTCTPGVSPSARVWDSPRRCSPHASTTPHLAPPTDSMSGSSGIRPPGASCP